MPRVAVAAPSRAITDAAIGVAEAGGSVVDVGIVAALTAMCTEPGICGPGGGGFMTIALPGRDPVVVDGYMALPGIGFNGGEPTVREVMMSYGGGIVTVVDAGSIAVPGAFACFELASTEFGTAPWPVLMEAVAGAVETGFPLSASASLYLMEGAAPIYNSDPVARAALFDGDVPKALGSDVIFPGLAETLREIGAEGASTFYEGDLAELIVSDLESRGGVMTRTDLASYEAVVRRPLTGALGGFDLAIAPSIGGRALIDAVTSADLGEPQSLVAGLIDAFSRRYAATRSPSTISVAAGDSDGGALAASFSAGYGSGVIPKGTGMLMNNSLGETDLYPDGHGRLLPGERLISNMAPSILIGDGSSVAVGSPGADRITSALAFTLTRLANGDDLRDAIDHPRAHPEFVDDGVRLAVEPGIDMTGIGYPTREFEGLHMFFGGVNGAGMLRGKLEAHADSRRTGSVAST